jgi:SRSO17 transposase
MPRLAVITLLDRDLYLPASWTDDPARCERAGIPADRPFATKPALTVQMFERARAAHVSLAWVTGDSVYGDDPELRAWFEEHQQSYVLGISATHHVWLDGRRWSLKMLLPSLPSTGWSRLSAGAGSKGPRWYDWMQLEVDAPAPDGWKHWALVRRTRDEAAEMSAYIVCAPATTTLADHVRIAGMRWAVEVSIQTAKGEVGLDQYEVRSWRGWYRHITLAMWASAFLSVIRAEHGAKGAPKKRRSNQDEVSSLAGFKARRNLRSD